MTLLTDEISLLEISDKERRCFGEIKVIHENKSISLPLSSVKINASVVNQIASVTHEQTFKNSFKENLEATYIFPLSGGATVSSFEMIIGEKIIKGKVKEREEARQEYIKAVEEGKKAALLEQERDDVFTVQVGNIPPSQEIKVRITYSEKLAFFENGTTEIRLPLVVAQRYIPGDMLDRSNTGKGIESDTDIVSDASRISPPRLVKGSDPKIDLSINVEIFNENGELSELSCTQHATKTSIGNNKIKVSLANTDELLDRDFILRWQISHDKLQNNLVYYKDKTDIYGMLTVIPPKTDKFASLARDIVFVVDRSGSMEGLKMTSATKACSMLLNTLGKKDSFSILAFDDRMEWFKPHNSQQKSQLFINADEKGIEKGNKFLREIYSNGGTELDKAMEEAISAIKAREVNSGRTPIIVLLTDGQIGDESRVLKRIQKEIGDIRVFTIGIDTAVNESFLKRLAILGAGTSSFVVPGEALESALIMISREIGKPVMTDISIKAENCKIVSDSLTPENVPDLFSGRTINIFFKTDKIGDLLINGKLENDEKYTSSVNGELVDIQAIPQLWAKAKIFDLEDEFRGFSSKKDKNKIKKEIIELSVKHSVLTKFTAFIAVDDSEKLQGKNDLRKVVQPVMEPAKWQMNTMARSRMASPAPSMAAPPSPPAGGAMPMSLAQPSVPFESLASGAFAGSAETAKKKSIKSAITGLFKKASPKISHDTLNEETLDLDDSLNEGSIENMKSIKESTLFSTKDKELVEAIKNLISAYEQIISQLEAGNMPDITGFKNTREKLSEILTESEKAFELIDLQKFMKVGSAEIINAFNNENIDADSLYNFLKKYTTDIEKIKIYIENENQSNNFWEDNI